MRRVNPQEFSLMDPISENGRIMPCKFGKQMLIAKKITVGKRSILNIIDECEKLKIKLDIAGIYFPDRYWDDKEHIYFIQEKHQQSLEEVLQEHRRRGQYIQMVTMKNFVSEFIGILGRVHRKKMPNEPPNLSAHIRLKPSNFFITRNAEGEEEYVITDFLPFSNDNLEEYMAPEQHQAMLKNSSQRFSQGEQSLIEQLGGDPQKVDIWQFGITFLQLATLRSAKELLVFRDGNTQNSVQAIEIKEQCRKLYGRNFVDLIDSMLTKNPAMRKRIADLDNLIDGFLQDQDIDHSGQQLQPDIDLLMKEINQKIAQKKLSFSQFFGSYNLEPMTSRLKATRFYDAMDDLGLKLTMREKAAVEQRYDEEKTGDLDFSQFVKKQRTQIKMAALSQSEQESLKELLADVQSYLVENNIRLLELFQAKDVENLGKLPAKDFLEILDNQNLGLNEKDESLVKKRYDPEQKDNIFYHHFCEDLQQVNSTQVGLPELRISMYKALRENYTTFISFFRAYDTKQKGQLSYEGINEFLTTSKLYPPQNIVVQLMNKLDPGNQKLVMFDNVREFFRDLIEDEVRALMNVIGQALFDHQMTFPQLIRANTKSVNIITQQQLFQALQSINVNMKRPDFNFLMSFFQAKDEIEYPRFVEVVLEQGKRLKVQKPNQFAEAAAQALEHQGKSYFDDPEVNRSITFNAKQFESQRELLAAIHRALEIRQMLPAQYFKAPNSRMTKQDYKKRLRDLQIPNFEEEQEDLLLNITVPSDRTQVDSDLLIEAILYYKAKFQERSKFQMHQVVAYFSLLNRAMSQVQFTFDEFQDLDAMGDGTIRRKQLERVLSQSLGLSMTEMSFKEFMNYLLVSDIAISLQRLKIGLYNEQQAEQLLYDLNMELAYDSVKPEQTFRKYDANRNGKLELKEFQELINDLGHQMDPKVTETLFYKLDDDGDLVISLSEFKKRISNQIARQDQLQKYKYKQPVTQPNKEANAQIIQTVLKLREILRDRTLTLDIFDKKGKGSILVNAFQDIIVNDFNYDFKEFRPLVNYLVAENPQFLSLNRLKTLFEDCDEAEQLLMQMNQNIVSGKVQLDRLFYNYDQNDNDVLEFGEFQMLVKDIEASAKPRSTKTLFFLFDQNQDNTISIQEFKQKIAQKEKPRLGVKDKPLLIDEIIRFVRGSPNLPQALDDADQEFTNKLTTDQMAAIFKKCYGPSLSSQEMRAFAEELGALSGNMVNYKVLVNKARQYQCKTPQSRIDGVASKLKEDLEFKGVSLLEVGKSLDINEKGRIKFSALKGELAEKRIQLRDDEWDLLLNVVEMDNQNTIEYTALHELVQLGVQQFKDKRKVVVVNTNQEIDRIVDLICEFMEQNCCSLVSLFRRTDKNFDQSLSQGEFIDLLHKSVQYTATPELQAQLFSIFDMDKDGKINFVEFEYQVYKRVDVGTKQIEEMKTLMLNGRNPQLQDQVYDLFKLISNGGQFIEFKQLHTYLNRFRKFKILEVDQFWRYLDPEMFEKVDSVGFMKAFLPSQQPSPHQNDYPHYGNQPANLYPPPQHPAPHQYPGQPQTHHQGQPLGQYPGQIQNQYPGQPQSYYPGQPQSQHAGQYPPDPSGNYAQNQYPPGQIPYRPQTPTYQQPSPYQHQPQTNQPPNQAQYLDEQNRPPQHYQLDNQAHIDPSIPKQTYSINYSKPTETEDQLYPPQYQPPKYHVQGPQPNQPIGQYVDNSTAQQPPYQRPQSSRLMDNGMPMDFDREFYEQRIKRQCIQFDVDYFDLLAQYDKSVFPDLRVTNVADLERVFQFLEIPAPTQHINEYFHYYSNNQNTGMSIVQAYIAQQDPGKLLAKALNFTMIKHKDYSPEKLWHLIGKGGNFWLLPQFQLINQNLRLGLTQGEVKEALHYWDTQGNDKIGFKQYQEVLELNRLQAPNKKQAQGGSNSNYVLEDLILQLSEIVQSKNCFNLYEELDKKQYGEIALADFERVTKQLMIDITPQELLAVRKYMSKDGQVNLSDLAKALKIDRKKAATFNQEDEKKQFGLANKAQRKSVVIPEQQQKFKKVVPLLNEFLKKKQKTYDDLANYFFPPGQNSTLDKPTFARKCIDGGLGISKQQAEDVYDFLDANSSGQISINEFRLVFQPQKDKDAAPKKVENIVMSQDIESEIKELFDQIDENKNGTLDQRELQQALVQVGLNPSVEELRQYFTQFDRDNSGTISYNEFASIVKDILRKELLSADDLLEELRREFRQVCNPTTRLLSKEQMSQVFQNLGVNIRSNELDDLFEEIDEDKSGTVDIDEFIYFIQRNQSGMSAKASAAIMNIKGTRRISLHDLKQIFLSLPNNFIMSFIRNQNKKLLNLPSSVLKPQLDQCGFFYSGLNYVEAQNFDIKKSILDKSGTPVVEFELRLLEATGVPIPDPQSVDRASFMKREIGMILIDKSRNRFEGNSCYITADWSPDYEDRWTFNQDQAVIFRWANFDNKLDSMVEVVFEFITYSANKNRLVQISCAYGSIPVSQLRLGKIQIDLRGGAPLKEITIEKKDVRASRTGWRSVVQAISANVKSQLVLEVVKLPQALNSKLANLPNRCLLNRWGLGIWAAYRDYFATRTMKRGEIELTLASDLRIKSWLNCVDCPDTQREIARLYDEFELKCNKTNDYGKQLEAVQQIADQLYLVFRNSEFKFLQGDPTGRVLHDQQLKKRREQLVTDLVADLRLMLKIVPATNNAKKAIVIQSLEPLNVEEMMDLDNEQDIAAIEKFLNKKRSRLPKQQPQVPKLPQQPQQY